MSLKRWFLEQEPQWRRFEALLDRLDRAGASSVPLSDLRDMGALYRMVISDLARAQASPEFQHVVPYLNSLAQRGHGRVYTAPPTRGQDVLNFLVRDFPRCVRRHAGLVLLAGGLFWLGAVVAMLTVALDPATERFFVQPAVIEQLDQGVLWTDRSSAAPSEASFLMTNNIRVAINAFALGVLFGVGTLVLMLHNGLFAFGGPMQVATHHGMGERLLNFIAPHGMLELTTIFIAGAAGMVIGFALLFPGEFTRWQSVRRQANDALVLIMGCVPLLVLAGMIEGLISLNQAVPPVMRWWVGGLSALGLFAYLGWSGRQADPQPLSPPDDRAVSSRR